MANASEDVMGASGPARHTKSAKPYNTHRGSTFDEPTLVRRDPWPYPYL